MGRGGGAAGLAPGCRSSSAVPSHLRLNIPPPISCEGHRQQEGKVNTAGGRGKRGGGGGERRVAAMLL